jgi:hypothetical protein
MENAQKFLVINFLANIGLHLASLRKVGVRCIRHTRKPRTMATAGCSEIRMSLGWPEMAYPLVTFDVISIEKLAEE